MFSHQPKKYGNINKKIIWPKIIQEFEKDNIQYQIRPIDKKDIPQVVELYNLIMPYVFESYNHDFLFPKLYEEETALLSSWDHHASTKRYFFGLIEEVETNKLVMAFGCRKDPYDLVIQNQAMVLRPEYRGNLFANVYMKYLDQVFKESGTDYVYGITSTQHSFAQKIVLTIGAGISGFMPSFLRRTIKRKKYYRDHEIYVYKFYNGSEEYSVPLEEISVFPKSLEQFQNHLDRSQVQDISTADYKKIPTKELQPQSIVWKNHSELIAIEKESFLIRPMDTQDIKAITKTYQEQCPYFYQSSNQFLLEEDFFRNEVAHLSNWDQDSKEKLNFAGIIENVKTKEIIMAFACRKEKFDPVVQNLAVVLNPKYRKLNLGKHYTKYMMKLWNECGAEYIYGYMTTQNTISQDLFTRMGGKTSAVFPGHTRRYIGDGKYFRDAQTYMYINLNSSEKYEVNFSDIAVDKKGSELIQDIIHKST